MSYTVNGKANLSIIEMAIEEYGSIDGIPLIIEDNFLNSFDELIEDTEGKTLTMRDDSVIDTKIKKGISQYPGIGNDMKFIIID